ncbi:tetratricopeptide repeat protein [Nocardia heshunensis]
MLMQGIGAEWVRHVVPRARDRSPSDEALLRTVLALTAEELTNYVRSFSADSERDLLRHLVLDDARAHISTRGRLEQIGHTLIALGGSDEHQAAGRFCVGYARRFRGEESLRQLRQAQLFYRDLGWRTLESLTALAAAATSISEDDPAFSAGLTEAFGRLETADAHCARRLAVGLERIVHVVGVVRQVTAGSVLPRIPFTVTDDELHILRRTMIGALHEPTRLTAVVWWIQELRRLPPDSTEEPDTLINMLWGVREWEACVHLLRDLLAHGDNRPDTTLHLAKALHELGRWSEAKSILLDHIGPQPGPASVEPLQLLIMMGAMAQDPDCAQWWATLRSLNAEMPLSAMPPPTMLPPSGPPPQLLARFANGTLTVDRRAMETLDGEQIQVHVMAAIAIGLGPGKAVEFLEDIAAKDPDLFPKVTELLPFDIRPQSPAQHHLAEAEQAFAQRQFQTAIEEYRQAIVLDPHLEFAHLGLGDAHYMIGEYELAIAHFIESIGIRPTPQAYRFLGDAYRSGRRDIHSAKQCYEKALELDPNYGGAREALRQVTRDLEAGRTDDR